MKQKKDMGTKIVKKNVIITNFVPWFLNERKRVIINVMKTGDSVHIITNQLFYQFNVRLNTKIIPTE